MKNQEKKFYRSTRIADTIAATAPGKKAVF